MRLRVVSFFFRFNFDSGCLMNITGDSCENIVLWRGHFVPTSETKTVKLAINGGEGMLSFAFINAHLMINISLYSVCGQRFREW